MKRTVFITGASSGIGRAVARRLLADGHTVIGVARDIRKFSQSHERFFGFALDLEDLKTLPQNLERLIKTYPVIDTAVFCAGFGRFGALEQFSYRQIESMVAVNITAQLFLARVLLPHLKSKPRSDLVFIGSEAALKGSRQGSLYCAGKFALRGFTQALREECGKSGLRIALINPGMVKTEFFDTLNFEPGENPENYLQAEDVAQAVRFVLNANPDVIIDELNLSPRNKVVKFKKK